MGAVESNDLDDAVQDARPLRVLYSYPYKIGAGRACMTAWQQVAGLARAGADVLAMPAAVARTLPPTVEVRPTLSHGKLRLPLRTLGRRGAPLLHDQIVARRLAKLQSQVDIVHVWPLAARETLCTAARLGIPAVLERPNAHTRFAYDVVRRESERLGVTLPARHEHAYNSWNLRHEEEEYESAYRLLCPSDFVAHSFLAEGFLPAALARHSYGYDEQIFYARDELRVPGAQLRMVFVGVAAVRKGLHYALEAWLRSPASKHGTFLVVGDILPSYAEKLRPLTEHPSVHLLGHRGDVASLLRTSDLFILPTLEEGSPLAALEALASGCALLVSDVCTEFEHMHNALVHRVGDVEELARQITALDQDPALLSRLRTGAVATAPRFTWARAGERLLDVYRGLVDEHALSGLAAGSA